MRLALVSSLGEAVRWHSAAAGGSGGTGAGICQQKVAEEEGGVKGGSWQEQVQCVLTKGHEGEVTVKSQREAPKS